MGCFKPWRSGECEEHPQERWRKLERGQSAARVQEMLVSGVKLISATSTCYDREDRQGRKQAQSDVKQKDMSSFINFLGLEHIWGTNKGKLL